MILSRSGIFNFFSSQQMSREGEKEKFNLRSLRTVQTDSDLINSTISDIYADAICRYQLLQDKQVIFGPEISYFDSSIENVLYHYDTNHYHKVKRELYKEHIKEIRQGSVT